MLAPPPLVQSETEELTVLPLAEELVDAWFRVADNPAFYASSENRLLWIVERFYFQALREYERALHEAEQTLRPIPAPIPGTVWLYRLFSADSRLLYIGVTVNIPARISKHRRTYGELLSHWTVEGFQNREEALRAERVAIAAEAPAFNYTHPPIE